MQKQSTMGGFIFDSKTSYSKKENIRKDTESTRKQEEEFKKKKTGVLDLIWVDVGWRAWKFWRN